MNPVNSSKLSACYNSGLTLLNQAPCLDSLRESDISWISGFSFDSLLKRISFKELFKSNSHFGSPDILSRLILKDEEFCMKKLV